MIDDIRHRTFFDDTPQIQDGDVVGKVAYRLQIVRDEEVDQIEAALQIHEEIQDLRLHRDIQGARRFVEDQEFRAKNQRPRHGDTLFLTSGQLMRILVQDVIPVVGRFG